MARSGKIAAIWCGAVAGVLALTACGGGMIATATPLVTVTPSLPTTSANVVPIASTTALALTPQAIATTTAPDANAPTPTPLANGLLTPTSGGTMSATSTTSTTGATTLASAVTATPGPSTPVTGSTSGTRAAAIADTSGTSSTSGSGTTNTGTTASGTRAATTTTTTTTSATTTTSPGATSTGATSAATTRAATASSGTTTATAARDMTTPAPNVPARITAEQFLNAVVKKADISAYLSPSLRAQSGGDGSKLLGITGSIQMFTIDSEKAGADGTSAVVHATITTAAGTMGKDFTMQQTGGIWQIVSVS